MMRLKAAGVLVGLVVLAGTALADDQYFEAGAGLNYSRLAGKLSSADESLGFVGFDPRVSFMMKAEDLRYGLGLSLPYTYYSKTESCGSGCSADLTIWALSAEPEIRGVYDITPEVFVGAGVSYSFLLTGKFIFEAPGFGDPETGTAGKFKIEADLASFSQLKLKVTAGYNLSLQSYVEGAFGYIPTGSFKVKGSEDTGNDTFSGIMLLLGYHYRFVDEPVAQTPPGNGESRNQTKPQKRPKRRPSRQIR